MSMRTSGVWDTNWGEHLAGSLVWDIKREEIMLQTEHKAGKIFQNLRFSIN